MSSPTTFGPYELQEMLGRGGMGEVYRAYDREQARVVALKLLPAALAADDNYVERFRRESYAAARLSDPHVIPIHRYGEIDGRLYIDMRLVNGVDLADLIARDGPLPPERAVRLIGQAAEALDAAHAENLVHRDVKPSNLLVTPHDFVYLVDFGIAQVVGANAGRPLTADGSTIGTFDYMAPERLLGAPDVDGRADVYSLACVLHEALTGRRPFSADTVPGLIQAHLSAPPPRVTDVRPELPEGLAAVITRGLAKHPADRQATAGRLAAEAEQALSGRRPGGTATTVPSPPSSTGAPPLPPPTYVPPPSVGTGPAAAPTLVPATGPAWSSGSAVPGQPGPETSRSVRGWLVAAAGLAAAAGLLGVLLGRGVFGGDNAGDAAEAPGPVGTAPPSQPAAVPPAAAGGAGVGESAPAPTTVPRSGGPLQPVSVTASCQAPPGQDSVGNTITYQPELTLDGTAATAWRCVGSAVGQQLVYDFATPVTLLSVGLVPGYAKIDPVDGTDRFAENRTVTAALWRFDDGTEEPQYIGAPEPRMTTVDLPEPVRTSRVVLEIVGTGNPAAVRDFTAISDVVFTGY